MKKKFLLLFVGAAVILAAFSAVAWAASAKNSSPGPNANNDDAAWQRSNVVDIKVIGHAIQMVNTDAAGAQYGLPGYKAGVSHDIIAPSTFVVKAGEQVTLHAWNYDDGKHTMTLDNAAQIPGFDFQIAAGQKNADGTVTPVESTITFTAPAVPAGQKDLDIPWYCALPCDGPTHLGMEVQGNNLRGYDGIMAGHIVVMN